MDYQGIFEGDKIKGNSMPERNELAAFVYNFTNYKLFTHNGIIYAIDGTNKGVLDVGKVNYTDTGLRV